MGQNIGTGGRAWGKILGPCEEYTGVDPINSKGESWKLKCLMHSFSCLLHFLICWHKDITISVLKKGFGNIFKCLAGCKLRHTTTQSCNPLEVSASVDSKRNSHLHHRRKWKTPVILMSQASEEFLSPFV